MQASGLYCKRRRRLLYKKLTTTTPLTSNSSHIFQCLQPDAVGITQSHPGRRVAPTAPRLFGISFIPLCQSGVGHFSASAPLNWAENSTRWFDIRNAASGAGHILQ
ncbi:hypothetical protein CSKR_110658 [Clonorchis sinensis]|uniref:Uncharacterized protein n=1 Tax=Clonorchis sinensis TaxID=79923 RepID=A0A3R7D9J1_CLOSI|nr:hypothetical protein CSKR_110658 [Clonorchis sinensis]